MYHLYNRGSFGVRADFLRESPESRGMRGRRNAFCVLSHAYSLSPSRLQHESHRGINTDVETVVGDSRTIITSCVASRKICFMTNPFCSDDIGTFFWSITEDWRSEHVGIMDGNQTHGQHGTRNAEIWHWELSPDCWPSPRRRPHWRIWSLLRRPPGCSGCSASVSNKSHSNTVTHV